MPCGQKQHKTEAILLTNSIKTEKKKKRERSTSKKHLKKEAAELFSHVSRLAFLPAERGAPLQSLLWHVVLSRFPPACLRHPPGCVVESHRGHGFNLHFLVDYPVEHPFRLVTCHSYNFLGEMSVQIFCLFFSFF